MSKFREDAQSADVQRRSGQYTHAETAGNVLSVVPQIFKFLRLSKIGGNPEYGEFALGGLAVLDLVCYTAAGI